MDTERPTIRCLVAYPLALGHVIPSRHDTVTLDEAVEYQRLGFVVLVDPEDEKLFHEWQREQMWYHRRKWL